MSPSSQISETASDSSLPEVPGPALESASQPDSSSTDGERGTDEEKESKKNKLHLHCPVCKVTVNSTSQLEAHNSGTYHTSPLKKTPLDCALVPRVTPLCPPPHPAIPQVRSTS